MSYRDICFCMQSRKEWADTDEKPICTNNKCKRHASSIPFERLDFREVFSVSDFSERCGEYKG